MPKAQTIAAPPPRATSVRQPVKTAVAAEWQPKSLSYVVSGDTPTHVQMTVEDYERLIEKAMVGSALAKINDPDTEWVDAKQFGRELAAQHIAEARKAAGLTQKQLGEKLGLPQSQISRIERNPDHTTVRTMKKIAKALGVDVSVFLR